MKRLRYAFLAVPLIGLVELAAHLGFAARTPSFESYADLAGPIRSEKKPGELVIVAPSWADPAARHALGDELMPIRDEARPDVTRYASALEISLLGQRAPDLAGWSEEKRFDVGKFTVRRLVNPKPAHVVLDFVDALGPAFADVRETTPAVDCPWTTRASIEASGVFGHPVWPRERFQCPGGSFFNVGVTVIADEEFRPRRCLWSHPVARGELVTRFRGVQLGASIHGHGGMYWIIERELRGAPVTLAVRVDGDEIGRMIHADGDGWKEFELALGAHANAASATVEFAVSTPDYRERHFCFEADTR